MNIAAPKPTLGNAGLKAMVGRIAKKNEAAAEKMEAILRKLRGQDCRGHDCTPAPTKDMEQWKADWILETEETGAVVP